MLKLVSTFFFLIISFFSYGQRALERDAGWSIKERLYYGGGIGMNGGTDGFGNRFFYIALNPMAGYMITKDFSAGLGINWQNISYLDLKRSVNQIGASPFLRYNFGRTFAYAEYNFVNSSTVQSERRVNYNRLPLGVGYVQPIGARGALNALVMYDVLFSSGGPFGNPWIFRIFFSF